MLELFAHPFSSYCWKVLIALYERDIAFEYRMLGPDQLENAARLKGYWPLGKFPVLAIDGTPVIETSIIIETLEDARYGNTQRLIPEDREAALDVRFMDRVFDNHVMNAMQQAVNQALATPDDAALIAQARGKAGAALDIIYDWLDARLEGRSWACGEAFTMADCAAAPALFYADWVHEIGEERPTLAAYRARLLARPSVKRCVEDARPYRAYFPLGAPDRD